MRLGCLPALIAIGLTIGGGQGIYTVMTNRKPVEISIQDLMKRPPEAKWLKVTGGELDTLNSVYKSGFGKGDATEIYVPVIPPGTASGDGLIRLLLLTKDPELVNFINEAKKMDETAATETEALQFALKNMEKLRPQRDVEGLVEFGIESNDKKRDKIGKIYGNLAAEFLILEDGKKPETTRSAIFLAIGLGLGAFLIRRSMKKPEPSAPPEHGAPPPPFPGQGSGS